MKIGDRLKSIFFYCSLTKEDYKKIIPDMKRESLNMIIILSGFSFITMVGLFFYSFIYTAWGRYRFIYIFFFFVFLSVYVFSKLNRKWNIFSPNFTIYSFLLSFYSFAAVDSIIFSPDVVALEPVVILFLLSAFFYFNLIETLLFITVMTVISSMFSLIYSSEVIKVVNITNFVIYGLINLVLSYLINRTYAMGFLNAYRAKEAGYMDFMTGLYNRNYYKSVLPELLEKIHSHLSCIYIDANDLHRINNEQGHEVGDQMLTYIAATIQEVFGGDYAFRIGGDEFVAFVTDVEDKLEDKCQDFKVKIQGAGFHASLGYASFFKPKEQDMNELIKSAEIKMYEDKKAFYETGEHDRRMRGRRSNV